ncbi:uncharacterized protein LOC142612149 [Castanea sativa]|uniref:uncharacterized protein LOC142612149 n=1 Tax=Castanea sativa TaxID=21020 RepID=UPI003F64FDF9
MIVKSKDRESHTVNLRKFFERIKEYRLRLNPQKCTFGVSAEKLLGFLVSDRGIEVDPSKIKVILEMPPPKRDAIGSLLAHVVDEKNEKVIYYLSKRFHDYETRYIPIEKSCFALVWAVQKLRHIILPFQIWVVARMVPLKYLFEKPALSGRFSRWLILLVKFDLKYVARKTIKESVMSDFCAKNPIEGEDVKEDFPYEDILDIELGTWKMYFDKAVNQYENGIGVLLITPEGSHIPLAIKSNFKATNNMAEYEACIAGMEALRESGVKGVEVFRDSTLVITQVLKLWKVKEEHLKPYQQYLEDLIKTFDKIKYTTSLELKINLLIP